MQKPIKKLSAFLVAGALLAQVFVPGIATAVTFEDGDSIELEAYTSFEDPMIIYANGYVTLSKNGIPQEGPTTDLEEGDAVVISLFPDEGYIAKLHDNVRDYDVALVDNKYSFTIGIEKSSTLSFTPSFVAPGEPGPEGPGPQQSVTYDFTLNGKSFEGVKNGDVLTVPDDFAIGEVAELYFTKIDVEGDKIYAYDANEYSYAMVDSEERNILETNFTKISGNAGILRVNAHAEGIVQDSIQPGKTPADYYGFYITDIYFVKSAFRGVEVSTSVMPDNYDFTSWNGVDLSGTSAENPGEVTVYYGEDTIKLEASLTSNIKEITVLDNTPADINNATGEITVLSNFYNKIPLKVELEDGTIGYLNVTRIGLFISRINKGTDTLYHGAFALVGQNLNKYTDQNRIAATFYHKDTETYNDYDLIATLTYADGTTEIVTAEGIGSVHNTSGDITGSDYIIWKGENNIPVEVSVTAVKKGALDSETTFGGATFGSGAGVTERFDN